jgi:hypothetical protein
VNKANNSVTRIKSMTNTETEILAAGAQAAGNALIARTQRELAALLTACSPDINNAVALYLEKTSGPEAAQLNAWRTVGQRDAKRNFDLNLNETARRTVSSLGMACLIAYARAWLDEHDAQQPAFKVPVGSSAHFLDDAPKCRPRGPRRAPRGRTNGEHSPQVSGGPAARPPQGRQARV